MTQANPYANDSWTPAALAAVEERAAFLRRTYALLLAGIGTLVATLWAAGNVDPVQQLALRLWSTIHGTRAGWLLYVGLFFGGSWLVHAFAERRPINLVLFFGFAFLIGLLLAPLIFGVLARGAAGIATVNQAALITALTFGGLTAYVFFSGKSFSFLGGILWVGMGGLIAVALAGLLFGFGVGVWYSFVAVALFAGYILYDTGQILHRYPTTAHVSAACVLFVDVVLLFKHILILLSRRD